MRIHEKGNKMMPEQVKEIKEQIAGIEAQKKKLEEQKNGLMEKLHSVKWNPDALLMQTIGECKESICRECGERTYDSLSKIRAFGVFSERCTWSKLFSDYMTLGALTGEADKRGTLTKEEALSLRRYLLARGIEIEDDLDDDAKPFPLKSATRAMDGMFGISRAMRATRGGLIFTMAEFLDAYPNRDAFRELHKMGVRACDMVEGLIRGHGYYWNSCLQMIDNGEECLLLGCEKEGWEKYELGQAFEKDLGQLIEKADRMIPIIDEQRLINPDSGSPFRWLEIKNKKTGGVCWTSRA